MLVNYETAQKRKLGRDEGGKSSHIFFETINEIWNLNHCYARIRIISAYCMFLLKRANHYRAEVNRVSTTDFVQDQFREMVKYKGQIVEIERQAFEGTGQTKRHLREEIKRLTEKLKEDLDHRFRLVAEKVGEKIPGETAANSLEMADEEVDVQLTDEYEILRGW